MDRQLAPNETIQLHELLTLKNLSLTKSATMAHLISDAELKGIMQQDAPLTHEHIEELRSFMKKSDTATGEA